MSRVWAEPQKVTPHDEAARLVRAALESEATGDTSDRQTWVDEAFQKSPNYAPARWLAGYVRSDGKWQSTADVQKQSAADSRLEQYRLLRDAATDSIEDNARFDRWRRLQQRPDGELAYKPVLRTTLRPEGPMLKISFNDETPTTTRGHLFWVTGYGWQQSRNLKPGTLLHSAGSVTEVEAAAETEPAEAYNLIVADFGTYFVGKNKILSHDNSTPKLSPATVSGYVPEK